MRIEQLTQRGIVGELKRERELHRSWDSSEMFGNRDEVIHDCHTKMAEMMSDFKELVELLMSWRGWIGRSELNWRGKKGKSVEFGIDVGKELLESKFV